METELLHDIQDYIGKDYDKEQDSILLFCIKRAMNSFKSKRNYPLNYSDKMISEDMGNAKFNENTRVQVPAALHLCKLGYTYLDNIRGYDTKTNILTDTFLNAVKRLNPELSDTEASQLFAKIVNIADNDDLGREFYGLLSSNSGIKLIDFENPDNNDWHLTTELTYENEDTEDEIYTM